MITSQEVRAIIETDMLDLSPFIKAAELQGDRYLSTVDADTLHEIKRWLAAHYIAVKEAQEKQDQKILKLLSNRYGLAATFYGQQAMTLDPSGALASFGKRAVEFETL